MARICERCGCKVGIGQGKWTGPSDRWELKRLAHKDAALCQGAVKTRETRRAGLGDGLAPHGGLIQENDAST
jgi:hypothetical protein